VYVVVIIKGITNVDEESPKFIKDAKRNVNSPNTLNNR